MNRKHVSKLSIDIEASATQVWEALVNPDISKRYFYGADVKSDWKEGSSITFEGEYNGHKYLEKGIIMNYKPYFQLQYSHWSNLEGVADIPENYRTWTFDLVETENGTQLTITEDNIPTEKQQLRSDEFWTNVLLTIKNLVEN